LKKSSNLKKRIQNLITCMLNVIKNKFKKIFRFQKEFIIFRFKKCKFQRKMVKFHKQFHSPNKSSSFTKQFILQKSSLLFYKKSSVFSKKVHHSTKSSSFTKKFKSFLVLHAYPQFVHFGKIFEQNIN